jgi:predicted ATPase/serine phosphatase RsbU (regulator of sigma subunit)
MTITLPEIPNYQVTALIYKSQSTQVYRAYKVSDDTPVILKTLQSAYPTITEIAKLKHEYQITKYLAIEGIVKPYSLESYRNYPLLVLEDFDGQSLTNFMSDRPLNLTECLTIGIQLTTILHQLHQEHIIHKDIKPQNIIINPLTQQVKITDFAISSQLSKENPTVKHPNLIEGTLAYMSPEQTGRMNRSIDYRTDFYSLGVSFYEMLTGELPFTSTDPLELVHSHIAKSPIPPHQIKPEIPELISLLVLKMLAKNAEERYQSAFGIKSDLEACLHQLVTTGKIEFFTLGQQDILEHFEIPQKLYGREAEIALLMSAFERIANGAIELSLVAGYSGIGKSALVNEIHKPIVRQRGYFISGKFDQYKRNVPYDCLIQAFKQLVRQLLTETPEQIANWQQKIKTELASNARVIVDVIPEVGLIIGEPPALTPLPLSEAQNRFNLTFKKFINIFTQKEHPVVIFLDDLQWADSASLNLIKLLTTDTDTHHLLIICAYRDNEVSPIHPFTITTEDIRSYGTRIETITLNPLSVVYVKQIVADTLNCPLTKAESLAELILAKTAGNPFFLTQLLRYLYLEDFIKFVANSGEWEWDLAQIKEIGITENVVDLMISKIQKLSQPTQNVLKLAACAGNPFDLAVLSVINEQSPSVTAAELWEALQTGLIVPLSDAYKIPKVLENFADLAIDYKFLHDRVQQAAYALIPDDRKKTVHLQVGCLLLQNTSPVELEEKIFDIVNQLNIGSELITDLRKRYELAELNLMAGRKAKLASAYEAAQKYLPAGLQLLNDRSWETHYDFSLNLYTEAVEVEYLNANFNTAQQLSEIALVKAISVFDRVKIAELTVQFQISQNQMIEAIDTALPLIELLGYPLVQNPEELRLIRPVPSLEELENFPAMTDRAQLSVLQILTIITGPAYQSRPDLLPYIVFKMVNLCLEFGHSALAAYAYGMYGLMLCGPLADIPTGYHSGKVSLQILEQYPAPELKCKIYMLFNSFIGHWQEPHRQTIPAFVETIQMGLETGDFVYITYCYMWSCGYLMLTGEVLDMVGEKQANYINFLDKIKQENGLYPAKIWQQLTLNLQGKNQKTEQLVGASLSQEDRQHIETIQNGMFLFFLHFAQTMLAYFWKDYATALVETNTAAQYEASATASMLAGGYIFYDTLVRLACYPQLTATQSPEQILDKIEKNLQQIQVWASHAPMNYQSKYELLLAEKARISGDVVSAMMYYDRAIESARQNGFIQEVAIGLERAGEFYLSIGRDKFALNYLADAYHAYSSWGANAKAEALLISFPRIRSTVQNVDKTITLSNTFSTSSEYASLLDIGTILKVSQAISGEIILDKLIDKLLGLAMENAGAQRGYLILLENDNLIIKAIAEVGSKEFDRKIEVNINNSDGLPLSLLQYVHKTQESVVLENASCQGLFVNDPYIISQKSKSILALPLLYLSQFIGIIYLENNLTDGVFTPDRLEVLKILSSQAAISIENARLYQNLEDKVEQRTAQLAQANQEISTLNQKLKAENVRMSAELDIVKQLQQMVLPKQSELEAVDGLEIAGFMEPADEVGGDYYDVLQQDGRVKISIGDVTGHGLESGVLMIMAQTAVRTLQKMNETDPVKFLDVINQTLYDNLQRMDSEKNMSLAILDYAGGVLKLSGQHEETIVVRADGTLECIDTMDLGFPIGLVDEISDFVTQTEVQLNPGDVVVLYTDGIPEAFDINKAQYGLERLWQVAIDNRQRSAQEIREAVIADVREYIGVQKVFDDITLVVMKQK